jgi:hypothetical protein
MPIPISFSEKDLLFGKLVTPGWYRVKVDNVSSVPSKDGGSTNYPVEGTILFNADTGDKEFAGIPLPGIPTWFFNSKAMGNARGFIESLGVKDIKASERYDLESAVGKEIDVFVENNEYQGRISNRVNHKYRTPRN